LAGTDESEPTSAVGPVVVGQRRGRVSPGAYAEAAASLVPRLALPPTSVLERLLRKASNFLTPASDRSDTGAGALEGNLVDKENGDFRASARDPFQKKKRRK
jgi:hypothetical protein